ncbi:GNAT family N-acetyltransferase [Acetobacter fallax]|uniref:GNAT family N-acetyltransferase n=1 Tax=Acetobacter fallax TaxID=1737473 RepID=A0ABX0K8Y2_9PROT|nr:GNAT family protein [Acetobacter fallax]NHO31005.1 GNAT family N-acetyltransferase [Acetobacter fallax]NHO34562.1 GNAT family N-acetyltransferase [Acetobacter fallax]
MLTLIPFCREYFPTLAGWFSGEKDVVQWGGTGVSYPLTPDQMETMPEEERLDPPLRLCRMVADRNGQVIGHIQLCLDRRDGVARIARVILAPEARGKGLALPLIRKMPDVAFSCPEIERVELNVYSWNTAAIRTYERAGFIHEGTRRQAAKAGSERWDLALMGLLRHEQRPASEPQNAPGHHGNRL